MTLPDEAAAPPQSSSAEQHGSGEPASPPRDAGERDDPGVPRESLGEIFQMLLENPLFNQALHVAFGARDAATQVTSRTMKNLSFASSADLERLGRHLRSLSERLEAVEDQLDELTRLNRQPPPAA